MTEILEASLSLAEYGAHVRLLEKYRVLGPLLENATLYAMLGAKCADDERAINAVIGALWRRDSNGRIKPAAEQVSMESDFAEFYRAYPRKKGRLHAQKAYARARKMASHADIMAGLMLYLAAVEDAEAHYIKHPATWLNSGGWMDEPDNNRSPLLQSVLRSYEEYVDA